MSSTNQYRKKPVVIEAIQWNGNRFDDTPPEWFRAAMYAEPGTPGFLMRIGDKLVIETLEGQVWAAPGDWIIRGVKGELYPCKPDIFAATYEAAAPVPASTEPAGDAWQVVPKEPTREMIQACKASFLPRIALPFFVAAYKTMLDHAPSPNNSPVGGKD